MTEIATNLLPNWKQTRSLNPEVIDPNIMSSEHFPVRLNRAVDIKQLLKSPVVNVTTLNNDFRAELIKHTLLFHVLTILRILCCYCDI
jgi:hypothetical protein